MAWAYQTRMEGAVTSAGVRVEGCPEVGGEPVVASVEAAVALFRERECDVIVAVGGGSSMDSAKAVSLLLGKGGKFQDYTERRVGTEWKRGRPVDKKGPPIMTVPTTAGNGAAVPAGGCGVERDR